ncbi:alpha-N-acetylgalactosamine-specific lectin-like [Antedon mediterranea]|uniref:alpha-N-acetylgalactosamine-specific lectin-like n=1 Tax=Antedon mediterranea TaxID=105859 RepID=UPI003AF8C5BC
MKLILSVIAALAAIEAVSAESGHPACHPPCLPHWVPFQESCYRAFGTKKTYHEAEHACHEFFNHHDVGHLVSIRSEAEDLFVYELWKSTTGNMVAIYDVTFWLGLTDSDVEGNWTWKDSGDVATYTNWKTGQPDNSGGEDCAHQSSGDPDSGTWNDWGCEQQIYYVCELPQEK